MKITVNTDVLKENNLTIDQFLVLLASYYNVDYQKVLVELVKKGLAERNLFKEFPPVISDNTKALITKVLIESDDKIQNCGIKDFEKLAYNLEMIYPSGNKPGTTYHWRGKTSEIAQKLRTLVVKYNFTFTEEEAIEATKEYVNSFKDYKFMSLLRNFILTVNRDREGDYEMSSLFMTIIENNRENETNN